MLLDVRGVREFARAMRAVAALTTINEKRIAEHRRTLAELQQQRDALEQRTRELEPAAQRRRARACSPRSAPSPHARR